MWQPLVLALLGSVALSASPEPFLPAAPSGFRVGITSMVCGGEQVLLRYPAQSSDNPEHYAPQDLVQELLNSGYYDQSADTIRRWATLTTHSTRDAKPRKGRSPLIVFLPGQGVLGFQYTILAEDLASHGYAIAVVDYFSPSAPKRSFKEDDSDALS